MLAKRGLPLLGSVEAYHGVFGFPVIDYYRRLGFDFGKEPFDEIAIEFIGIYHGADCSASLFPGAEQLLSNCRQQGIRQVILSASEKSNLMSQVGPLGISQYFDEVLGISDIYAKSKISLGREYINMAKPQNAVLVGDTAHDKETADALGVGCILVARGHQSKQSLLSCGAPVVDRLGDVRQFINV